MERRTSERLMNLTIALLTARGYLSRDRLRGIVEGYHGLNEENFSRQFERDKNTLRALGVPVETGTDDAYHADQLGYRIRRDDFELPAVAFDKDEVGVLVCAAQVWQQAAAAETTFAALAKLWAGGIEPDVDRFAALRPHISARESAWPTLWEALQAHQLVAFDYHGTPRTVRPWVLAWRHGAWYMAGFDETRDATRLFKLARITGVVKPVGPPEAFEAPTTPVEELLAGLTDAQADSSAVIDVRAGRAPWLTRRAALEATSPAGEGWQRWRLPYASGRDTVGDLAAAGADVRVVEPAELALAVAQHHSAFRARLGAPDGMV